MDVGMMKGKEKRIAIKIAVPHTYSTDVRLRTPSGTLCCFCSEGSALDIQETQSAIRQTETAGIDRKETEAQHWGPTLL